MQLPKIGYDCPFTYQNITDNWRKYGKISHGISHNHCDKGNSNFDGNKWFRFVEPAGTKLLTTHPEYSYPTLCGTKAIGWMQGNHPTRVGQIVDRKICFRFTGPYCEWSIDSIKVTACMGHNSQLFYLYQLKKPSRCSFAYCAV